jgi:hypothetical protein
VSITVKKLWLFFVCIIFGELIVEGVYSLIPAIAVNSSMTSRIVNDLNIAAFLGLFSFYEWIVAKKKQKKRPTE